MASFRGVASFHDVLNMYTQNITVRLKFSVQDICKLWSQCSHCKLNLHDCREYSAPFSPEMMMIVIDLDTTIYIEHYAPKQSHYVQLCSHLLGYHYVQKLCWLNLLRPI